MAKVGYERLQEIQDPSLSMDRAREDWQKMGRSEKWIQQRMTGQETRNKLTDQYRKYFGCKLNKIGANYVFSLKMSGIELPEQKYFLTHGLSISIY